MRGFSSKSIAVVAIVSVILGAVAGYISTSPRAAAYNVSGLTNGNQEILADPSRPLIYLAHPAGDSLDFINSTTGQVENTITVGTQPTSIDLSSNGTILYVAISGESSIKLVNVATKLVIRTISLNFAPLSIQAGRPGRLYVSSLSDGIVRIIAENSGTVVNSVNVVFPSILDVSPDGSILLTAGGMLDPVPVSKYSIATDTPSQLATDWSDLGDNFQQMAVDWAKGVVYVACGGPYGLTIANLSDLAWAGFLPMDAYTSGVALARDGQTVFGVNSWFAEGYIWGFNTTTLNLVGKIPVGPDAAGLAVAGDSRSAYITMPALRRFSLSPSISPQLPDVGALLGYTPGYVSANFTQGIPRVDPANMSILLDSTALSASMQGVDELRGVVSGILQDGDHSVNASAFWRGERHWANWSFTINRSSPLGVRPTLEPVMPIPGFSYDSPPWTAEAKIHMPVPGTAISAGGIWVDGSGIPTVTGADTLTGNIIAFGGSFYGSHVITACILWDLGLGSTWINWTFVIQRPPSISALYPAPYSALNISPDHIDIGIDHGSPEVFVQVACWIDNVSIATSQINDTTARALIPGSLSRGYHSAGASYTWNGTTGYIDWHFFVNTAPTPLNLTLVRYENPAGFAMSVPKNWSLMENQTVSGHTVQLVVKGPIYGSFQTNIVVITKQDSSVRENNDYLRAQVNASLQGLTEQGIAVTLVEGPDFTEIANHSATTFAIKWSSLDIIQKFAIIVSEEHERYWIVTFSIEKAMYQEYNATFNKMIAGFEITLEAQKNGGWTSGLPWMLTGVATAAAAVGIVAFAVWSSRRRGTPSHGAAPQVITLAQSIDSSGKDGQFICYQCGRPNPPGAMFCSNCGLRLMPDQHPGGNPPGS